MKKRLENHWYKRDPDAALDGMRNLTLEERGAYNTILDLIYSRKNRLPDDDYFIAGHLRVDLRVWRRLRKRLVGSLVDGSVEDGKKLYIKDGCIRNLKADIVINSWLDKSVLCSEAAIIRHAKSPSESINNKGMTHADAVPRASQENKNKIEDSSGSPTPPSNNKTPKAPNDGEGGVLKLEDWKGIEFYLTDRDRAAARKAAPDWDLYYLMRGYDNEFVPKHGKPKLPGASFIAYCQRYTKGKPPQ